MERHSVDVVTVSSFVRCEKLLKMGGIVATEGKKSLVVPTDTLCNSIIGNDKKKGPTKMAMMRLVMAAIEYYENLTIGLYEFIDNIATIESENFPCDINYPGTDPYEKEALTYMQGIRRKIVCMGCELNSRDYKVICKDFDWNDEVSEVLVKLAFELFDYEVEEAKVQEKE